MEILTSVSWPINDSPDIRVIVRPEPHINPLEEERYDHTLGISEDSKKEVWKLTIFKSERSSSNVAARSSTS